MRQRDLLYGKPVAELQPLYDAQVRKTTGLAKAGQFAAMPQEQQTLQQLKRALEAARRRESNEALNIRATLTERILASIATKCCTRVI